MKFKKMAAAVSAVVLAASAMPLGAASSVSAAAVETNYAEALQKSMFFYEVQQAGILPEWNRIQWRANSMVKEDGTPSDVVDGGWFDAGDHYKFTLTNAYSASVLAWGYIQNKDAIDKAGLGEEYRNNVQWGLDYVLGCDNGDGTMVGTIGDSDDHVVWCSCEVYMRKHKLKTGDEERPYDNITDSTCLALSAAALAEGYIIFKDTQPDKATEYLKHAKSLFESADKTRSNEDQGTQKQFYPATTWVDDCMYAANWLYMATGDESYLKKCETDYIPQFPQENQSTSWKYTWGFCWDDTTQGAALLYAINTGKQEWIDHICHHLDYWIDGYGGKKVEYSTDGLAYLMNWGSLRHVCNTIWLAEVACDTILKDNSTLVKKYTDWGKGQIDYIFGDNSLGMTYVLGMGDLQPSAFHHRTASGIHDDHWNNLGQESGGDEGWQTEYAHTLYGALVGGPDKTGNYKNDVSAYEYSEVAIDYNAGYTCVMASYVGKYGGTPLANFPPDETPKWAEWEVAATLNGSGDSYTEIKSWTMNHTAWPTRVQKDIEVRYFFDVSEVLAAGLSVDDIGVRSGSQQYSAGEQGYATVAEKPIKYDGDPTGNTYYVSLKFEDGRAIQPTGQSEHRDEVQFRIYIPDAIDGKPTKGAWDPTNDWSYEGVPEATDLKKADSLNEHICMYVNGALAWGTEPDGTKATPLADIGGSDVVEPDKTDVNPTVDPLYGDVNCDKKITVADAIMLARVQAEDPEVTVTEQGLVNGNVNKIAGIQAEDVTMILKYVAGLITTQDLGNKS